MRKIGLTGLIFLAPFWGLVCTTGCSNPEGAAASRDMDGVAVRINDYVLDQSTFNAQLLEELEYESAYKATAAAKAQFLDCIIQKEVLTQEAKKRGLDQDEKFIAAIEKYWQATLIKHLMEIKNQEITHNILVSDKDIAATYEKMKENNPDIAPLTDIEPEVAQAALDEARSLALDQWIQELKDKAKITINQDFINE